MHSLPILVISLVLTLSTPASVLSSPSSGGDKNLEVSINVTYTPPSTFQRSPPYYSAASSVTLTCYINGTSVTDGLYYEWSSDCDYCFALGESTQAVSTAYLESKDTGTYTCLVYDGLGCSGNANITIKVVGAGIYVTEGEKTLPNNGVIVTSNLTKQISEFRCLSGSKHSSVGHVIGVNGTDIMRDLSDPFHISRGGKFNPGMVRVQSNKRLTSEYEGVYTCRIPNESGDIEEINVGLYQQSTADPPVVTDMLFNINNPPYSAMCNSVGSPATNVIWTFNGKPMSSDSVNGRYKSSKKLVDRRNSLYVSTMTIDGSFEDLVGEYSCVVMNELGTSNVMREEVKGLYIVGNDRPIIVGLKEKINCSTLLNVTKIEWILVGIKDDPVEKTDSSQSLSLPISPTTTGLNGAMFTCRAESVGGKVFEETITIHVKELDNFVKISGRSNPLSAGDNHTIVCTVESDITPTVIWLDVDGNEIAGNEEIIVGDPVVSGNTTLLTLTFAPLRSFHGGIYYCRSEVDHPPSIKQASKEIYVQLPSLTVTMSNHPEDEVLYTTEQLEIACVAEIHNFENSALFNVSSSWSGPALLDPTPLSDGRVFISNGSTSKFVYDTNLFFSNIQSSDTGRYTCSFTATSPSPYVVNSETASASTNVKAELKVSISVSYTPPDQYPTYSPPNYRAASSISLHCSVEGATGLVTYEWSSTCDECFTLDGNNSTVSEPFLRSRDNGVHTCTATDSLGNSGSYSEPINIVGAGIYVTSASEYGGATAAQPNNSYIRTINKNHYDRYYFALYCCSGSVDSYVGSIRFPSNDVYNSEYRSYLISRYSNTSDYAGCIHLEYSHGYTQLPHKGVHTCHIPDENRVMQNIRFAIYRSYHYPILENLYQVPSHDVITVACVTYNSPPTNIIWTRDGQRLAIDGKMNRMTQYVTDRHTSRYNSTLKVYDNIDNATGVYSCIIDNRHHHRISESVTINGIQVTMTSSSFVIGQSVTLRCTSDLDPSGFDWYRGNTLVVSESNDGYYHTTQLETTLSPISTNDEGEEYKCVVRSPYGTQERSIIVHTQVPDSWGTVQVHDSSDEIALHGTNYTLTCTVSVIEGLYLPVNIEWVNSNDVYTSDHINERIFVERVAVSDRVTTLTLRLNPILTTDGGDFTCRASVNVSWMDIQPPVISDSVHVPVRTQALFQLKMGPVQYCVNWNDGFQDYALMSDIRQTIENVINKRCDCGFNVDDNIYSEEFSCQTSTTHVTYRAIINGTSDLLTAQELLDYIEDWRVNSGTLLHRGMYRLRLTNKDECPLQIDSFDDLECSPSNKVKVSTDTDYLRADYCYKLSAQDVENCGESSTNDPQ